MAKRYRGKTLRTLPKNGRGTCLQCGTPGIKLLHEKENQEGKRIKVCKRCASN